jgi:hypothetical protein
MQFPADGQQFFFCADIRKRAQIAASPLGPTVSKMNIGDNKRA